MYFLMPPPRSAVLQVFSVQIGLTLWAWYWLSVFCIRLLRKVICLLPSMPSDFATSPSFSSLLKYFLSAWDTANMIMMKLRIGLTVQFWFAFEDTFAKTQIFPTTYERDDFRVQFNYRQLSCCTPAESHCDHPEADIRCTQFWHSVGPLDQHLPSHPSSLQHPSSR